MTVLFLIDTLAIGGAERSILEIASRFKKVKPVVCYIYNRDELRSAYEAAGIEVVGLQLPIGSKHKVIIPRLLKIIDTYQPDIIHATLYRAMMVSRKLKRITGIPLVNSFVSNSYSSARTDGLRFATKMKLRFYQYLDKSTAKVPDIYISNSVSIAKSNAQALRVPMPKIKVIYRGRDKARFKYVEAEKGKALKESLHLKGSNKILLNVSRLRPRKGQADLIHAFTKIHLQFPDAVLLIAGEGIYRGELEKLINSLNLQAKVKLLGNRNDVEVLLSIADAFVFPSYYEGLPGAIVEAMMAEKIIIASAIPENLECIDERSALLFPSGNINELSNQLKKVLLHPDEYAPLAKEAVKQAEEKFEIDNIVNQYEQAYEQLIQS